MDKFAIATSSGGYKGVFIYGVLSAFESMDYQADAYASCSSSALVSALAAVNKLNTVSKSVWSEGKEIAKVEGNSQSNVQLESIDKLVPLIKDDLFNSQTRFLVSTSFVKNEKAASETQSDQARRLGRKLLIEAGRNITTWKDENLEHHFFDTFNDPKTESLTPENLKDVLYATTRMLHAWHIPAFINGEPYIDGSYTIICPVLPLSELGYEKIICISTEHGHTKLDFFSDQYIPDKIGNALVTFIKPDCNLAELGVDFYKVTDAGLDKVFEHGLEKGKEFLSNIGN